MGQNQTKTAVARTYHNDVSGKDMAYQRECMVSSKGRYEEVTSNKGTPLVIQSYTEILFGPFFSTVGPRCIKDAELPCRMIGACTKQYLYTVQMFICGAELPRVNVAHRNCTALCHNDLLLRFCLDILVNDVGKEYGFWKCKACSINMISSKE